MAGLLDKRLIFVAGKGGVGKSTVAAAIGMVAARRGLRTIVAEVSRQDRVSRAFAHEPEQFREVELAPNLFAISIDPELALQEYLQIQIKVKPVADVLAGSRMFHYFAVATPGLQELVTIGKVWELAQLERRTRGGARYDLVIVDAPATGHGVAFMRTPKTFSDIARVGPVASQGRTIHEMIVDPSRTGVVAVALPEEMPVNETLMLRDELRRALGLELDLVVANAVYRERFSSDEADTLMRALESPGTPLARAAVRAALSERTRAHAQREQLARLREGTDREPAELPFLFESELGPAAFEALSHVLEEAL